MKNKIIVISISLFLVVLCFLAKTNTVEVTFEAKEDEFYRKNNICDKKETDFCTHLPIVTIDTNNQAIPGEARDGTTIRTDIKIIDNKKGGNHIEDKADIKTEADIRYRGNSSMHFDKKGYLLNFVQKDGTENKVKVMGMEKHDEWVLHGPFLDKTLIKNYLWYNISRKMMDSAPDCRFCELFVDGDYKGLYLMVEAPTRGDKSRMQISKYNEKDDFSSYIVRFDRPNKNPDENLVNFSFYTYLSSSRLEVIYPGKTKLKDRVKKYINDDISRFEKALYSYDYDSFRYGYKKYLNVDSFVNYLIINEFTQNVDAGRNSTYIYKDIRGKYNMYVWDFNNANNSYINREIKTDEFEFQLHPWFEMLLADEYFTKQVLSRYQYLRKIDVLKEEYLLNYIDDIIDYLGDAVDRNFEVWGYTFQQEKGLLEPFSRNPTSYEEAVKQLKTHIKERGRFLDKYFVTIKQFSAESKVKKYNH